METDGTIYRLVITKHDNGQLLHYNKQNLVTLTLTDGSKVEIKGYADTISTDDLPKDYYENITDIKFGKVNVNIGINAFHSCTNLKTVTFEDPTRLQSLESYAFEYCSNLETFGITSDTPLKTIPFRALRGCGLKSIVIPDTVETIGSLAFLGCTSLTEITIPKSVTKISMQAFQECTSLTKVTFLSTTPPNFGGWVFKDTNCTIYVPSESVNAYKKACSEYANKIQAIPTT